MISEEERAVEKLVREADGEEYEFYSSLEEARLHDDAYMIMEGDCGGTIFLSCPVRLLNCGKEKLLQILDYMNLLVWDTTDYSRIYYEPHKPNEGLCGGMGGGWTREGVWIHPCFMELHRKYIEEWLLGADSERLRQIEEEIKQREEDIKREIHEAEVTLDSYDYKKVHSDEEDERYVEALKKLIDIRDDGVCMLILGRYNFDNGDYDAALEYLSKAAEYDRNETGNAYMYLGDFFYTGEAVAPNYEIAYGFYDRIAKRGHIGAMLRIAEMQRNGHFLPKDKNKYVETIFQLYDKFEELRNKNDGEISFTFVPELSLELAEYLDMNGYHERAVGYLKFARKILSKRIAECPSRENLVLMKDIVEALYDRIPFNEDFFFFFDILYLLKKPHEVVFRFEGNEQRLEAVQEDGKTPVFFNGQRYENVMDFFRRAAIDGTKVPVLYKRFRKFRLLK